MQKIKIVLKMNTQACVAVSVVGVSVCGTIAYVLSRQHAPDLVKQIPATVSALPSARPETEERRPTQLRKAGDVA